MDSFRSTMDGNLASHELFLLPVGFEISMCKNMVGNFEPYYDKKTVKENSLEKIKG